MVDAHEPLQRLGTVKLLGRNVDRGILVTRVPVRLGI
jgi:hypothetical protein